jgi:hypothetical protein
MLDLSVHRSRNSILASLAIVLVGGCAGGREESSPFSDTGYPGMDESTQGGAGPGEDAGPGGDAEAGGDDTSAGAQEGSTGDEFRFDVSAGGPPPDGPGSDDYCGEVIDVVFVMDVSTSMDRFFDKLEADIVAVDAALKQLGPNTEPRYGLVVFVDDVKIISNGMAYTDIQALRNDFAHWNNFTSTNQQVNDPPCGACNHTTEGPCSSDVDCTWIFNQCFQSCGGGNSNTTWPENSLDALHLAAEAFDWRPAEDTQRVIIHTTDDTFWEGPATQNGVMIQHDYSSTVKKLQDEQIRVFSFAGKIGGQCGCENVAMGFFEPYKGQMPIPDATLGEVFHIVDVYNGTISLADALPTAIDDKLCDPYVPPG